MFQKYYVASQTDLAIAVHLDANKPPFLLLHFSADPQETDRARFEFVGECSDEQKQEVIEFYGLTGSTFHPQTHKTLSQEILHEATLQIVNPQNLGRNEYGVAVFYSDFETEEFEPYYLPRHFE